MSGSKAAEVEEGRPEMKGAGRRERGERLEGVQEAGVGGTDAYGPPSAGNNLSEAASGAGFRLSPLRADHRRAEKVWPWEELWATEARTPSLAFSEEMRSCLWRREEH